MEVEMKRILSIIGLLSAVALVATPGHGYAQATDPASVVRAQTDAFNSGNVDEAMSYFADNAVVTDVAGPPGQKAVHTGKAEIRAFVLQGLADHPNTEIESVQVSGDTATVRVRVSNDMFRKLGFASLEGTGVLVVKDGKIVTFTRDLTPESAAKLGAALGGVPGMPSTGSADWGALYAALILGMLSLLAGARLRHRRGAAL